MIESSKNYGYVSNVQRFTVHDGPGIRTELFLKGCSLRCEWCSNPETYERSFQVGVRSEKCICCGYCLKVCEAHGKNAIIITETGVTGINRDLCDNCMLCLDECYAGCLVGYGEKMTVAEAMKVIRRDIGYYERSGGGVTFSGGECLLQWEFVRDVLKQCKEENIDTCVETALHVNTAAVEGVAPYTDLFIIDIKHMDSEIHKKYTGAGNERILNNAQKIVELGIPLIIRIPVIPGFNDTEENIDRTADFILNELNNQPKLIQLLPYLPLGEEKAKILGVPQQMKDIHMEDDEREDFDQKIHGFARRLKEQGIPTIAGSKEKMEDYLKKE